MPLIINKVVKKLFFNRHIQCEKKILNLALKLKLERKKYWCQIREHFTIEINAQHFVEIVYN